MGYRPTRCHGSQLRRRSEADATRPVQLTDGPVVEWLGGHNPLSPSLSAYLVIDGDPPHYLAFGQSEEPDAPPASLEGIYFAAHEHPQTDSF